MLLKIKKVDAWLHRYWPFLLLLCLMVALRIPNFFEPYWYGDEGIYLTLGTAMRHGERLYAEIIDHKTPLIYYLAMVPTQLQFRTLLLAWMLVTTTAFYLIIQSLIKNKFVQWVTTLLFILFTTLPWLEGNIPNGELFVMGFFLVGMTFFTRTELWQSLINSPTERHSSRRLADGWLLFITGIFSSLAILTKVPALFDLVALVTVSWFTLTRHLTALLPHPGKLWFALRQLIFKNIWLILGVMTPIVISIVYFIARGSGQAYLDYGLLYNFRYAGNWVLPFDNKLVLFLFTLPGKALISGLLILVITVLGKLLRPSFQFVATWVIMAFFASLLSNRPYPHYFLQVIPPLALLLGVVLDGWLTQGMKLWAIRRGLETLIAGGLLTLSAAVLIALKFGLYPTVSYYQQWLRLMSGQISTQEYQESFNPLIHDNYQAAAVMRGCPNPYLFIWGTNPMLYALSEKVPTGRFTVSFHIKDFQAYDETMESVKQRQPTYIVVMKDETMALPGLNEYLAAHYMPNVNFTHFTLWKAL